MPKLSVVLGAMLLWLLAAAPSAAFEDQTAVRLPVLTDNGYGLAYGDVDGDGDSDLILTGAAGPLLLLNDAANGGIGAFAIGAGLPAIAGTALDAVLADLDGDDAPDLYLAMAAGQDRLLLNNGAGVFTDQTTAGLPAVDATGVGVAAADLDGDGDNDLVVANRGGPNRLLLNDGSGQFSAADSGRLPVDADATIAVVIADLDGDGAEDLFFANDGAQNRLFLNNGLGWFTEATATALPPSDDESQGAVAADADGDGALDLIIANGAAGVSLLINDGSGVFSDASAASLPSTAEYAIAVAAGDIDFDGSIDLAVANAGQDEILLNDGNGNFVVSVLPVDQRRSFAALLFDADLDFDLDLPIAAPIAASGDGTRFLLNDLAFPRIRIALTPDYVEATDPVEFSVETFDEDGVAAVALTVTPPGGGEQTLALTGGSADYVPQVAGAYTATVTAEDSLGNVGTRSLVFEVLEQDLTAPTVVTTVTPSEILFGQAVAIQVTASDDRAVVSRRLEVAGAAVPLDTGGNASYTPTTTGTLTAEGFASDAAGNEGSATDTFTVLADTAAPTLLLTLDAPTVDLVAPLLISTDATDNVAVSDLTITVTGPTHPDGLVLTPDAAGDAVYTPYVPGTHTVTAIATDPSGNQTTETEVFEAVGTPDTTPPVVTVDVAPATVALGNAVTLTVNATDDIAVASRSLTINGTPVALDADGIAVYTPPVIGDYSAEGRALDPTGNEGVATSSFRAIDPASDTEAPTVSIDSPADSADVSGSVAISGSAEDATLVQYTLAYAPLESADFTTFATGDRAVTDGVLGTLDTTLLENGYYQVRLSAEDANGRSASTISLINVTGELKLGIFTVSFQDKTIPVGRLPISVTRTYDSRRRGTVGDFGHGWNVELTQAELVANRLAGDGWQEQNLGGFFPTYQLTPTQPHFVTIRLGDDREVKFRARPFPESQTLYPFSTYGPTGMQYVPVDDTDVGTLTASGEDPAWFSGDEILDFGFDVYNPTRFTYTAADGFQYIFTGSKTSVRYSLIAVIDPAGLRIDITPDGFTRSDGLAVSFVRDGRGRITSIEDPAGNVVSYEYDAAGDLEAVIDAEGNRAEFDYDDEHYLTEMRDPSGNPVQRNEYDEDGRLIAITDAAGNRVAMEYDLDAGTQIVRDRRNNPSIYEYDNQGNVIAETGFPTVDGVVQAAQIRRTFDANGQVTQEILPNGVVNTFAYDRFGNVTEEVKDVGGLNLTTTYTYNASGRLLTETDPRGHTITHTYNVDGDRDSTTDREGNMTLFEYTDGLLTRATDTIGNYTAYEHDAAGNVIAEERWDGNRTLDGADDSLLRRIEYVYDAIGNKLEETVLVADGSGGFDDATTSWTYDANGRTLTETDPRGKVTTYEYDEVGNRIAEVDPLGNRTEYQHGPLGDLIRVDYPDGGAKLIGYDADGNRTSVTKPNGHTTTYVYDALDRVIRVDYPEVTLSDGSTRISSQQNLYDAVGNLIGEVDERGNRTDHAYDAAGRRTSTRQPEVYDAVSDGLLRPLTQYEYDANGNRIAVVDANGNRTEYSFDNEDRPTGTLFPDGNATAIGYDDLGRETSRTDALGLVTEYAYDALDRQTSVSLPPPVAGEPRPQTLFTYDELGNALTQTDANGHVTVFTYDLAGNRLTRTLPGLQTETFVYDDANRVSSHTDFKGAATSFDYDGRGRRTRVDYPDGTSVVTVYTLGGQRLRVTDDRGVTTYAYDERDRLISRTDPDGLVLDYGYTPTSQVATVTTATGTTSYGYDSLDRLASVTDPDGNTAQYGYDAVGSQAVVEHANGTETRYGYNSRNQLTSVEQRDSGGALFGMQVYTLDANGLRTRADELPMGSTAVVYDYDDNHRLIRETRLGANAYDTGYTYDAVGNRTEISRDGVVTSYVYDANDRLISAGTNSYVYDANGNLTSVTAAGQTTTFVFDAANRLVQSTAPGGLVTDYSYDMDGNRVLKSVAAATTRFLVDVRNHTGVAQVLEEHGGAGLEARYSYGLGLLSQNRAGTLSHYHPDGLGSIRALTDATQAVTDTYVFDAYGNEVAATGTTENPYRFAGEAFDPNVGFYYLRARYYDAMTGRFVSMDPAAGDPQSPMSLHRYLYANDNPVNFVDPTGRFTLISINISISIQSTIRSIYTKNLVKFFLTAARIAYCQLEPAYQLQAIGIDMMFQDLPGAELVIYQSRSQIAAGYKAIGNAALAVYQDTLDELVDFKVEFGGVLADIYNWASGSGGLPIPVPLPDEAAEVIAFYKELEGWFDQAETAYKKAKEGIEAATSGDACQQFKFLEENADTLLGKVPDF